MLINIIQLCAVLLGYSYAEKLTCHIYNFSQSSSWINCTQFRCLYCAQFLRNCAQGLAISRKLNPNALETLLSLRLQSLGNSVSTLSILITNKRYLAFTSMSKDDISKNLNMLKKVLMIQK